MRNKPLNFIHIGLGKCASTYLQNVFLSEPKFKIMALENLVEAILINARKGAKPQSFPNIKIDMSNFLQEESGQFQLASSEGFTFAFINEPEHFDDLEHLYRLSAHFLGEGQLSSQVLLMLRDPIDWLRAAHQQHIKGGGYLSYGEFYQKSKKYLMTSLDIKKIIDIYAYYFHVVTMSADDLKNTSDKFWGWFSNFLDVEAPSKESRDKAFISKLSYNPSLRDRTYKLAALNKQSVIKKACLLELNDYYKFVPADAKAFNELNEQEMWCNRRMVEFSSLEKLKQLYVKIDGISEEEFAYVYIDEEMKQHLLKCFIEPLEKIDAISTMAKRSYLDSINCSLI